MKRPQKPKKLSRPKRQHTVPIMYQRRFALNPHVQYPNVHVLNLKSMKWTKRSVRNTAVRKHYYTVSTVDKLNPYIIEEWLSSIEGGAAYIFDKKIDKHKSLGKSERLLLSAFISTLRLRSPFIRQKLDEYTSQVAGRIASMMYKKARKDERYFDRLIKQCEKDTGYDLSGLSPEDFNPDDYELGATQEYLIGLSFTHVIEMAGVLANMHWTIFSAPKDSIFITSDNPYFEINPNSRSIYDRAGLLNKSIEITVPISKQQCLLASWKKRKGSMFQATNKGVVDEINKRTINGAHELIIASTNKVANNPALSQCLAKKCMRTK